MYSKLLIIQIVILDENNAVKFTSAIREIPEEGATYDETVPPAYIAFSADGIVETVLFISMPSNNLNLTTFFVSLEN